MGSLQKKKRPPLLPQILCGLLFCFTIFVFAPVDMVVLNRSDFWFGLGDFVPFFLLMFAVAFVVIEVIYLALRLLPYPLYMMMLALLFGLTVALYVQGNFLARNNSVLTGGLPEWYYMPIPAFTNIAIWAAILIVALGLMLVKPKFFLKAVPFACALILVMEGSALTVSVLDYLQKESGSQDCLYYSDKDQFTYSQNGDVLVFMLDRVDTRNFDRVLSENPEYLEALDGFTYYRNAASCYHKTYPSFVSMLTGRNALNQEPFFVFTDQAFQESTFFPTLRENGITIDIYGGPGPRYYFTDATAGQVDNILSNPSQISNMRKFVRYMMRMVAYRYAPMLVQPFVIMDYPTYFNDLQTVAEGYPGLSSDQEPQTMTAYRNGGVTVDNDRRFFKFYATHGAHEPYCLNRDGAWVGYNASSQYDQLLGCFKLLSEWLDGLKEAGVYDTSTIVILSDHGEEGVSNPMLLVKYPGETGGEIPISAAPVSLLDLRATACYGAGIDYEEFGKPVQMWEGATERERFYYVYEYTAPRGLDFYLDDLVEYTVPLDATALDEYRTTGNIYRPQ